MNLAQVISFFIYTLGSLGISVLLLNIIDEHNCDKLTEEMYLESSIYKKTNTPYEQGLKACYEFQNALSYVSFILPIIGIGLGIYFFRHYRTKEIKK